MTVQIDDLRSNDVHLDHAALADLDPAERLLFQRFGVGPVTTQPYERIQHAFESHARRDPAAIAVTHLGDSVSYADLDRRAERIARLLVSHGVVQGEHVGLFLRRSIDMVAGILGVLKAGAAYVPQDVRIAPTGHLTHIVRTARTRVVLTRTEFVPRIPAVDGVTVIALDALPRDPAPAREPNPAAVDELVPARQTDPTAVVIYTSGTTGAPNGVRVTHANLCNVLLGGPAALGMTPGTKVAQILNIAFDMAVWEILGALSHGATLVIRGRDIEEAVRRADVVIATPSILATLDVERCATVRTVAVAGERCPRALADAWTAAGVEFHNSCGPTEVTIVNSLERYAPEAGPLTIGRPLPNTTVYLLDQDLRPCPIGAVGEMWAGGACVSAGYVENAALTDERYLPDPFLGGAHRMFRTRDLASWTPDGQLLHHGRTDDQVKVHGFRVELDAVTGALERAGGCTHATTLLHDGELVSFVCPATADVEAARGVVAAALPYYYVPAAVHAIPELPRTDRGKVDKAALRTLLDEERVGTAGVPDAAADEPRWRDATGGARQRRNRGRRMSPVVALVELEVPSAAPDAPAGPDASAGSDASAGPDAPTRPGRAPITLPPVLPRGRRLGRRRWLMHHNRLAALVLTANAAVLGYALTGASWWDAPNLGALSSMVVWNLALAVGIRQQYVINALFWLATRAPTSWPLRVRWTLGKVYHFGGLHVGATVAATGWFMVLAVTMAVQPPAVDSVATRSALWAVTYLIAALLLTMIVAALPGLRARHHDRFERVHRFGGWAVLALFWCHSVLFLASTGVDGGLALITAPQVLVLALVTASIAAPWLRLRRVPVDIVTPSSHVAVVRFDYGVTPFAGSSTAVSRHPLLEWHSFANVPAPNQHGFRLTISRAGDWTAALIDDAPTQLWVKGIPTAGVGNIDRLFRRVVWVATGSGIGPCLPHLLSGLVPARLVWSTRNARGTYGDALVDEILGAEPDALVWETDSRGKPDLLQLAYEAYAEFEAEAVICISNKQTTWRIVEQLELRGIPAYGAIWDS